MNIGKEININGATCVAVECLRLDIDKCLKKLAGKYPHVYHLRHGDANWNEPATVENFAAVNFFGILASKSPIKMTHGDYTPLTKKERQMICSSI